MTYQQPYNRYDQAFQPPPMALGRYPRQIIARTGSQNLGEIMLDNMLAVSSTDRNYENYPDTNDFVVVLERPYTDIVSIELIAGSIPRTDYNVNTSSNAVEFQETNDEVSNKQTVSASIPVGNYTNVQDLLDAVSTAMSDASNHGVTYTATVSPLTSKVTIEASGGSAEVFNMVPGQTETFGGGDNQRTSYKANTALKMLGFRASPMNGPAAGKVSGSGMYRLAGADSLILAIDNMPLMQSPNSAIHDAFCMLNFGEQPWGTMKALKIGDFGANNIKYFNPVLPRLHRMRLRFLRPDGSKYDFNGNDVTLVFEIKTLFKQLAR